MAELHPEECWFGLYWAGQRRQVGISDLPCTCMPYSPFAAALDYLSNIQPWATFQFHHPWSHHNLSGPLRSPVVSVMGWLLRILEHRRCLGRVAEELRKVRMEDLSSKLHSIPAHPRGIWGKKTEGLRQKVTGALITCSSVTLGKLLLISCFQSVSLCHSSHYL